MVRIISVWILSFYCSFAYAGTPDPGNYLVRCNEKLIEVIMEDVFPPPVASRVHVYPNIAAYEVLCKKDKSYNSLSKQLYQLNNIPDPLGNTDLSLSALIAFTTVAKKLVYSEHLITEFEKTEIKNWLIVNKNDSNLLNQSIEYGQNVANVIIEWIAKDNYNYTRTLSRYVLSDEPSAWQPTGPDYMNALEPNWPLIRSFMFDSSNRIKAIDDVPFSEKKKSLYYENANKLYKKTISLDTSEKLTALYWDDNPNTLKSNGHLSYFVHKVSPAGHWIRITGQAIRNLGFNESKTAHVYTLLTIALYEGFLGAWIEKYNFNAVRPETYINKLIASKWKSLIETPPFPEYPSAHSVISSAAATVLTEIIPQPYSFTDSSQLYIDIPPRHFKSFREASDEASISRFYGGIHYMPSLDNGIVQGKGIGNFILKRLKFIKN